MTKRLLIVFIVLLIIYLVIPKIDSDKKMDKKEIREKKEQLETRGVFISYMELDNYINGKDEKTSKENIDKMINNIKNNNFNTIYLQVRSHMDSIYKSELFPTSKSIILEDGSSYDVLDYFIKKAKQNDIKLYAWINPYRIGTTFDDKSKYYDRVKNNIKIVNNSYYLNPSSLDVTNLIVDGVEEIVKNYKVDGIIFDDYFYPSCDIDNSNYEEIEEDITIEEYRLNNISNMLLKVNKKIKELDENILFGVSPEGNIENNYNNNFADVKKWASEEGYVDFLVPQIYYGFDNETKPFDLVIKEWSSIVTNDNIKLYGALGFYKTGKLDEFAKSGKNEWIENSDIIKRQVISIRNDKRFDGFSIFRYDNLFNEEIFTENTIKEFNNLKEVM